MPELPDVTIYIERMQAYICGHTCCQTGGRVLADRALSRLLRDNWPRTLEELERIREPKHKP